VVASGKDLASPSRAGTCSSGKARAERDDPVYLCALPDRTGVAQGLRLLASSGGPAYLAPAYVGGDPNVLGGGVRLDWRTLRNLPPIARLA